MKKTFCLILSILMFGLCFTSCKNDDSGEISLIVSNMYGTIGPVDIYKVKNGYMEPMGGGTIVSLEKRYNYCLYRYNEIKSKELPGFSLLAVNTSSLGITTTLGSNIYYSTYYYGGKTPVNFVATVSFYKTLHIKLEERDDTYKITYYNNPGYGNIFNSPISFNKTKELNQHKKVVEVPKSDIIKIEYII